MTRVLILCTHNSARSQMAEGWVRHYAHELGADIDVTSAGTEQTQVKPEAIELMREVGIDLSGHTSKELDMLPDPWAFDVVVTVCDSANEACPVYPAKTTRSHVSFPDPSGQGVQRWREVRDALGGMSRALVETIARGQMPTEALLTEAGRLPQKGLERMNVLFLCTGNSARSQMAEAFLRHYGSDTFNVHSAGLKPNQVNPYTICVIEELGFDMSGHYAKSVRDFLGWSNFAYIITVCAKAEENCPSTFPGKPTKLAWSFEDPAAFGRGDAAKLEKFRVVRNQIGARVQRWVDELKAQV